jgi:hypothetical protein
MLSPFILLAPSLQPANKARLFGYYTGIYNHRQYIYFNIMKTKP